MKPSEHRRKRAMQRLTEQLKSGVKPDKDNPGKNIPLTPTDVARIENEISTLIQRLK